ncbi:O-antigen ligase family protein [Levilactobacillus brevis]|uniref:O-antigen ligase family protein n=1 Tax=Levilactobacillus brevis TaxID=1580 RepID=UPI0035A2D25A
MKVRLREKVQKLVDIRENAVFLLYAIYEVCYYVFGVSRINTFFDTSHITFAVNLLVLMCLTFYILTIHYTLEQFLVISFGMLAGLYAYYALGLNVLLIGVMFMAVAKEISLNNFIQKDFKLRATLLLGIILANRVGLIPSLTGLRLGTITIVRDSLGFGQYNITGALIMICILEYIYLNFGRVPDYGYGISALVIILTLILTNSRGSMLASIIYVCLSWLCQYRNENYNAFLTFWKNKFKYTFVAFTAISLFIVSIFNPESSVWQSINQLTSDRINILNQYFRTFGIPALPQQVSDYRSAGTIVMDNVYVTLAIQYGIIVLALFIFCYYVICKRAVDEKNFAFVLMLQALMIFGVIESTFFIVGINFTVMMIFANLKPMDFRKVEE